MSALTVEKRLINKFQIMKALRFSILLCATFFLVSCTSTLPPLISWAHFSSPIEQSFRFNPTNAVVYGCFANEPNFSFGNRLALRLHNEDVKREYLIELKKTNSVYGITVEPGKYYIAGFVATFVDHRTVGRVAFTNSVSFEVKANCLTYLGDFLGNEKIVGLAEQDWSLTDYTNNFNKTTEEFRNRFPNLAAVPAVSVFDQQPK